MVPGLWVSQQTVKEARGKLGDQQLQGGARGVPWSWMGIWEEAAGAQTHSTSAPGNLESTRVSKTSGSEAAERPPV